MKPIVVVGDTLLDRDLDGDVRRLCPDAPVPVVDQVASSARAGGAGLAAALLAADGRPVMLVTALSDDDGGARAAELLRGAGVELVPLALHGATPEKIRVRSAGRTLLRVDRGGGCGSVGAPGRDARAAIGAAAGVLVADYGNGVTAQRGVRETLARAAHVGPVVWDPHPRGAEPVDGCRVVTPNQREAAGFAGVPGEGLSADIARARRLRVRWNAGAVAVTLGREGAVAVDASGTPLRIPAVAGPSRSADACGAGDRFAATAVSVLGDGGLLSEAVTRAVEDASAFVHAGGASRLAGTPGLAAGDTPTRAGDRLPEVHGTEEAYAVAERVRAAGGTVVATGGCFDLLHAGHVRTLEAARGLGDCLVVCLNSDESIRALKGAGRPVVPAADRAEILRGLRCVDAVAVFDEPSPDAALRALRPHVWAKGADYTLADLPEAATVASWGGQTVVLPYLAGRSTTRMLKEASRDA